MYAVETVAVTQAVADAVQFLNGIFVMLISAVPNMSQPVYMVVMILGAMNISAMSTPIKNARLRIRAGWGLPIFILVYVLIQAVLKEGIIKSAVSPMAAPASVKVVIIPVPVLLVVRIQDRISQPVLLVPLIKSAAVLPV